VREANHLAVNFGNLGNSPEKDEGLVGDVGKKMNIT